MEMSGQFHVPAALPSGKGPPLPTSSTHWTGGWVGRSGGGGKDKKTTVFQAVAQSLYWLSYRGSALLHETFYF
jgi:hypothetical protein